MIPATSEAGHPEARPTFDGSKPDAAQTGFVRLLPALVLVAGFVARIYEAAAYFLNPDEAIHFFEANQPSLALAYRAALTNAHPPLLILVLYFWRALGHSEFILRLPSVLAGTACCWLTYRWLKVVAGREAAFLGLLLMSFSPAFIRLSAEVRQYALLLFFVSACLYLVSREVRENSIWPMAIYSLSLYGAMLVHYSGLLFAFVMGVYMIIQLWPFTQRRRVAAWAAGQAGGIALGAYFVTTHLWRLRQASMLGAGYDAFVGRFIFHPGSENALGFAAVRTLQVFTYFFSHGLAGSLGLAAFLCGVWGLLRNTDLNGRGGRRPYALAVLIVLAFAANCVPALLGKYPYGATRHSALLFPFLVAGVSVGLSRLRHRKFWWSAGGVTAAMVVCNLFPAPPPAIRPKDQSKALMQSAIDNFRHSAPEKSIVIADYQSALLFGYYICGHSVVQTFLPMQPLFRADCGAYTTITPGSDKFRFNGSDIAGDLGQIRAEYAIDDKTRLWIFSAGWITDSAPAVQRQLKMYGCSPQEFGKNIFWCQTAMAR